MWDKCLALLSYRVVNFLSFMVISALLAFAIYLQDVQGLVPCPLCMIQRFAFYGMALLFLVGIFLPNKKWMTVSHAALLLLCGLVGLLAAGKQLWLIHFASYVPPCGADFYYMLQNLPFGQILFELIHGQGDCAKEEWFFMGVGIVTWSSLALLGFFLLSAALPWWRQYYNHRFNP